MPAEQANGGRKIAMVVGGALALGLAACAVCLLSKGPPGRAGEEAVHRERANLRDSTDSNTARSRLVIQTPSPEPHHQGSDDEVQREDLQEHRERDEREKKHREKELHEEHHHTKKQHDHSEEHNATTKEHNATKEEHNATEEEHNTTKKEHGHKHKQCKGGPQAACECMLKCEVFGASPSECHSGHERNHSETRARVDGLISRTMLSHRNMCDGMRCVKDCAKELECLDEQVTKDCSIVKKNYADNKMDSDPDCDLSCDS
mmetsp:Transcript_34305/g.98673  ORF Transcript_34305/g.98673 Transcript_34305/m.98673 type:complete len:261 (+) Transcript_34305:60-842(+)